MFETGFVAGWMLEAVAEPDVVKELVMHGGNEKFPQVACVSSPWSAPMGVMLVYRSRGTLSRFFDVCSQSMSL